MISLSTRHSPNLFIYPRKKTMVDTGNVRITIQSFLCHIREIPAEVKFGGVTRAYSESVRSVIKEQVQAIAKGIEAASGNTVHIHYADGYPSAFNDKELMDLAADAVRKELGEDAVLCYYNMFLCGCQVFSAFCLCKSDHTFYHFIRNRFRFPTSDFSITEQSLQR